MPALADLDVCLPRLRPDDCDRWKTVAVPAILDKYSAVNWSVVPKAWTASALATNDSQSLG